MPRDPEPTKLQAELAARILRLAKERAMPAGAHLTERYRIKGDDPLSARADYAWVASLGRGDWHTRTKGRSSFTADARNFHVTLELDGFEGDKPVFNKRWERKIPRDLG